MAKLSLNELAEQCQAELRSRWVAGPEWRWKSLLPAEIQAAVDRSVNSPTKSYRYVLPTQVLAKVVDSSLDCRSIQGGSDFAGAFDARSLCHKVVVPFDRQNHNVLGGAPEPYVNNPLRVPSLTAEYRSAQRNKEGFDDLCLVLEFLEANRDVASSLLECVLAAIRQRLDTVQIVYPVPNRASFKQTTAVVDEFLSQRTGGIRLQAMSVALFRTIGERFQIYEQVETARINAADASTESVADLTCFNGQGQVVLAVEVKNRELRLRHIQDKLPAVRKQGVRELLFVVTSQIAEAETAAVEEIIDREFVTGQNVYVATFQHFLAACLILFGEAGRRQFLIHVGKAIDDIKADLSHRQKWKELLQKL